MRKLLDQLILASPQQKAIRLVALLAALAFLGIVPAAGGVFHPVFTVVAVLLSLVVVLTPESNAPLGLMVYLGALWALSVPGHLDLWTLAAAVVLCVLHLACTLTSYGPSGLTLDADLLGLWRRRLLLCVGAAVLVWASARTVAFLDVPGSGLALGLALLVFLTWVTFLTVRLAQSRTE
ncbi:MAG: hypothetical protein ABIQ59_08555 [Nocardioidaceae bacterium]